MKNYVFESLGDYLNNKSLNEKRNEYMDLSLKDLEKQKEKFKEAIEHFKDKINKGDYPKRDEDKEELKDIKTDLELINKAIKSKKLNENVYTENFSEAMYKIHDWLPNDPEIEKEYYDIVDNTNISRGERIKQMEEFLEKYADKEILFRYIPKNSTPRDLAEFILYESLNESLNEGVMKSFEEALHKFDDIIDKDDEMRNLYEDIITDEELSNEEKIVKIEDFLENVKNLEILQYYIPQHASLNDFAEFLVNTELEYVNINNESLNESRKEDPKAKVRNRGKVIFPTGSSKIKDNKDHFERFS